MTKFTEYLICNGDSKKGGASKFTNGSLYMVEWWLGGAKESAVIKDDNRETCVVKVGSPSSQLEGNGQFDIFIAMDKAIVKGEIKPLEVTFGESYIGNAEVRSGIKFQYKKSKEDEQLEQVKKALRCPDGMDVVKQAEIVRTLADALIKLQNSTNC